MFSYDEEIIDETINVIKLLLKQVPVEEIAKKLKLPVEEVTKIRDKFNQ
ncbi:helix-turn-helix domain-containing protein [Bacillus sp. FJAT-29937]|nr:helix-turn-helix domain-containing protein [Bacillus sp. FJAT-29937]